MLLACCAKKACLALARLLEMLTDGERSCDHTTPRQMALLEGEIVVSPTSKDATPGVIGECCSNSNFSMFSWRSLSWVNLFTTDACYSRRAIFASNIVCMPQRSDIPLIHAPVLKDSNSTSREAKTNRKRSGDMTDPCLTPHGSFRNCAGWVDLTLTQASTWS